MTAFAEHIRSQRKSLGMTQTQLAQEAGLSTPYINDIELRRRHPPPDETLASIASALGVTADRAMIWAGRLPIRLRNLSDDEVNAVLRALNTITVKETH